MTAADGAAERLHRILLSGGATVATAESLTGGRLAARITDVPGVSATYRGGAVTYATELKVSVLGVPEDTVARHGVVSAECAAAMAEGARSLTGATYALSTTGVAGPDQQEDKPAGTVYVGVAGPDGVTTVSLGLSGTRTQIQEQTCDAALAALAELLDPRT
ncbi:CinA family protein [Nocardioides insulae]|uniref:CinA family protein n=1 Tax=Nocardioides insulae TaxID=394734 RepID=UPI0004088F42|nr:CinA family protein [Nocardioides insulae]